MITFLIIYLSIGFGFSLGAWLEVQEKNVKNKEPVTLDLKNWLFFIALWWLIAIADYRINISRTAPPLEILMEMIRDKKNKK